MRLIDADKLKPDVKTFTSAYSEKLTEFYSQEAIDNAPAVEVEPVRHGKWLRDKTSTLTKLFSCSECKGLIALGAYAYKCYYDYCPNCGAKMDEDKNICG